MPAFESAEGFLTVPQGRIAYQRLRPAAADPSRPAILLLHEALGAITMWRDFPGQLAERFGCEVIAWDRIGHGKSSPDTVPRSKDYHSRIAEGEVAAVIAALDLQQPPILFGHSDGATIALLYAARHPVAAVIAEAGHVMVDARTIAGLEIARRAWAETDLSAKLARHHGDKTEALFRAWNDTWLSPDFADWSVEAQMGAVTAPCLILQGKADDYAEPGQVGRIVDSLGGPAEGKLLVGCRHIPHLEKADEVLGAVADFLSRYGIA